jgi:hypothetical protein
MLFLAMMTLATVYEMTDGNGQDSGGILGLLSFILLFVYVLHCCPSLNHQKIRTIFCDASIYILQLMQFLFVSILAFAALDRITGDWKVMNTN